MPFTIASLEGVHLLPLLTDSVRLALNPLTEPEFNLPAALQAELLA